MTSANDRIMRSWTVAVRSGRIERRPLATVAAPD